MTVLDHVNSAGVGALGAVGAGAGAVVAVGAGGGVAGGAVVVGIAAAAVGAVVAGGGDADDPELKPRAAMAGALCSTAAIAFTAYHFSHEAPQPPALIGADAPAKVLSLKVLVKACR